MQIANNEITIHVMKLQYMQCKLLTMQKIYETKY